LLAGLREALFLHSDPLRFKGKTCHTQKAKAAETMPTVQQWRPYKVRGFKKSIHDCSGSSLPNKVSNSKAPVSMSSPLRQKHFTMSKTALTAGISKRITSCPDMGRARRVRASDWELDWPIKGRSSCRLVLLVRNLPDTLERLEPVAVPAFPRSLQHSSVKDQLHLKIRLLQSRS